MENREYTFEVVNQFGKWEMVVKTKDGHLSGAYAGAVGVRFPDDSDASDTAFELSMYALHTGAAVFASLMQAGFDIEEPKLKDAITKAIGEHIDGVLDYVDHVFGDEEDEDEEDDSVTQTAST